MQLFLLSVLVVAALGGTCMPASVLVGYSINDGDGATTVSESTTQTTYSLGLSGTAAVSGTGGIISSGIAFGTLGSGKITLTTTMLNTLGQANCWQMSAWVKIPAAIADGTFVKNWGSTAGLFAWGLDSAGTKQTFNWAGLLTLTDPTALSFNTYHHVAVSMESGGTLKLWTDGVAVATGTTTTATTTIACLGVGAKLSTDCLTVLGEYLTSGFLDDLSFWTSFYDPVCFYNSAINTTPYGWYNAVGCNTPGSRCQLPSCASSTPSATPSMSPVSVSPSIAASTTASGTPAAASVASVSVTPTTSPAAPNLQGVVSAPAPPSPAPYTQEEKLALGLGIGLAGGLALLATLIGVAIHRSMASKAASAAKNPIGASRRAPKSSSTPAATSSEKSNQSTKSSNASASASSGSV